MISSAISNLPDPTISNCRFCLTVWYSSEESSLKLLPRMRKGTSARSSRRAAFCPHPRLRATERVRLRASAPARLRACARDAALNLAHGQAALSPKFGYCFDGLILANMVLLSLQSADVYQEDDALHLSIGPIGMLFALGSSRCATHACITPPHARCLRVPGDVDTHARG